MTWFVFVVTFGRLWIVGCCFGCTVVASFVGSRWGCFLMFSLGFVWTWLLFVDLSFDCVGWVWSGYLLWWVL